MALCDYHLCAVCGGKAFYDASCSNDSYLEMVDRGAIKALCYTCEQTHEIIVFSRAALAELKGQDDEWEETLQAASDAADDAYHS